MRLGLWDSLRSFFSHKGHFFSHRAHRVHGGFWRTFRAHRTPSAYRVHRALLLKVAVRFCEIGWLNVSMECCVFCSSVSSVRKRMFLRESENSKHPNRNCQNFSVVTPFSVWGKAKLDMRRGPSAFKNMPFLCVKDALLASRRASSLMLCVMGWFVVGYKACGRDLHTSVLKMFTSTSCNDFSQYRWCLRGMKRLS